MSPVTTLSCLRHQHKKAHKFSHLINITCYLFNTSLHKKISCLRRNKSWWQNNLFTHLTHFLHQNLTQFLRVSNRSVSKMQHSYGAVSSYTLISKVISASFTQQNNATSWHGGVVFLPRCTDCSQSPLLGPCHDGRKIISGGRKPMPPVLWPAWACIWQCWHVEADLLLQLATN
jgi:hypothetical protein